MFLFCFYFPRVCVYNNISQYVRTIISQYLCEWREIITTKIIPLSDSRVLYNFVKNCVIVIAKRSDVYDTRVFHAF